MRVLLLLLCLLFASCGTTSQGPHVQGPVKAVKQPTQAKSKIIYNLGTSPAHGRILPLPKGYYGYITVKNYTGDALYLVCSKQVVSNRYMHIIAEGVPFAYDLNEDQIIGLAWEKTKPYGEVKLLIIGVPSDSRKEK